MTDIPDASATSATPGTPARPPLRALTPLEGRVVAVLLEKQFTVPDTYPLSLNALASGCNQKTARSPVMSVGEDEILTAIDGLKSLSLVFEGSSSRVPRFEQNLARVLNVPSQSAALLSTLLLRGPQTAAELRLNTARLHAFADISSVEGFLDELVERNPALVVKLPRSPGEREHRWMHLLCGEVAAADASTPRVSPDLGIAPSELEALRISHRALEVKVARLQALVEEMAGQLGISIDPESPD
ncbi:MAG: YceH family protein [Cupriavidus sp.]|nr:YceH family protein [Cupriavidus sp.]